VNKMKKKTKAGWIATTAAVAVLSLAGVAGAATTNPSPAATPGAAGTCAVAAENPQAAAELQALRTDFFEARQAWLDKYGDDRMGDEAQAAMQQLRDDRTADVQAVFDEYGIEATAGAQTGGHGGGMMSGGNGGGMGGGMGQCLSTTATD
jgi:hypothetical protein